MSRWPTAPILTSNRVDALSTNQQQTGTVVLSSAQLESVKKFLNALPKFCQIAIAELQQQKPKEGARQ